MKILLISIISAISFYYFRDPIVNTTWKFNFTKTCVNTYKFKPNNVFGEYDCELNYTMKGTYKFSKDTLIVTIKDDSHSEDGGKPIIDRTKYFLVQNNRFLYIISTQRFEQNKWHTEQIIHQYSGYKKVK
jgi:hypothetical protein